MTKIKQFLETKGIEWAPRSVMSDMSQAIAGAVAEVFPKAHRLWCSFHVMRAWETHMSKHSRGASKDDRDACLRELVSGVMKWLPERRTKETNVEQGLMWQFRG